MKFAENILESLIKNSQTELNSNLKDNTFSVKAMVKV